MKRLIKQVQKQALFFPACRSWSAGWLLPRLCNFAGLPLSFFLITACPDPPKDNTPERDTSINLEVLSTFTTTAKLHISVEDTTAEWTFGLKRNGEDVLTATVYNKDTTFTDGGLTPGTQYTYQVQWLEEGIAVDSSLAVTTLTMDTTSHSFTWEFDTLGIYPSYLNDVAVINENNIWVVGEIKTDEPDTVHNLPYTKYNAAHWDGSEWEFELIGVSGVIGNGIYYFAENDIWVATGIIYHWNGDEWERYHLWDMDVLGANDGGVTEIWGTSPTNIYFTGRKGSIVHYDGTNFSRMESGTDTPIIDIWGTDENHIWATAYTNSVDDTHPEGYESVTLFYDGTSWEKLYVHPDGYWPDVTDSISGGMTSVWAFEDTVYICSASGIWAKPFNGNAGVLHRPDFVSWAYLKSIRGNNYNDIYISTKFSQIYHFNGISWKKIETYSDEHPGGALLAYGGLDVKGDMVAVAGVFYQGIKAFIMRGYRME